MMNYVITRSPTTDITPELVVTFSKRLLKWHMEKVGVLFAGDTIINNVNRLSRPLPFGGDRRDSEQSLLKLTGLDFDICCFGHGPPLKDAKDKVRHLATNYPKSPLYWRIARNWRRLLGFGGGF